MIFAMNRTAPEALTALARLWEGDAALARLWEGD